MAYGKMFPLRPIQLFNLGLKRSVTVKRKGRGGFTPRPFIRHALRA